MIFFPVHTKLGMNKNARVTICGATGVGKTALFRNLTGRQQEYEYTTTFGVDLGITDTSKSPFVITFYDFSGNPAHHELTLEYVMRSDLILMVYDVHDLNTLARLRDLYEKYISLGWRGEIILVGNKIDAIPGITINNTLKGSQFALEIQVPFVTVSSKTGRGLEQLREAILTSLTPSINFTSNLSPKHRKIKCRCCTII